MGTSAVNTNSLILQYMEWFYKSLVIIHKGTILAKLKTVSLLSIITSPFVLLFDKILEWMDIHYEYVAWVLVAIAIDHILGSYVHGWIRKDFTMKKNIRGFLIKITMVLAVGLIIEGIESIVGKGGFLVGYFETVSRLMVFIYPAGSAIINCTIITKGAFPPIGWVRKITKFNKDMDFDMFKDGGRANKKKK